MHGAFMSPLTRDQGGGTAGLDQLCEASEFVGGGEAGPLPQPKL